MAPASSRDSAQSITEAQRYSSRENDGEPDDHEREIEDDPRTSKSHEKMKRVWVPRLIRFGSLLHTDNLNYQVTQNRSTFSDTFSF